MNEVQTIRQSVEEAERQACLKALEAYLWNVSRAAPQLGIDKVTLYRKMKLYGIKRPAPG